MMTLATLALTVIVILAAVSYVRRDLQSQRIDSLGRHIDRLLVEIRESR